MAQTDWTFGGTWPYEPRWFDGVRGRMHYVDEGPRDAAPVVLVHGNPTWSYNGVSGQVRSVGRSRPRKGRLVADERAGPADQAGKLPGHRICRRL